MKHERQINRCVQRGLCIQRQDHTCSTFLSYKNLIVPCCAVCSTNSWIRKLGSVEWDVLTRPSPPLFQRGGEGGGGGVISGSFSCGYCKASSGILN